MKWLLKLDEVECKHRLTVCDHILCQTVLPYCVWCSLQLDIQQKIFLYYHWTKPFCQKPVTTSVISERENKRWWVTYQVFVLCDKHDERCTLGVCQLHQFCCHLGASLLLETTISSWHHSLGIAFVSKQIHTQNHNIMPINKHNFNMKQSGSSPC